MSSAATWLGHESPDHLLSAQPAVGAAVQQLRHLAAATTLWFCLVALLFSQRRVRAGFARLGHWFDRAMGAVLVGLGVKLAFTQLR